MSEKQLTNLAVLMDLLNISTIELSAAINMERSSISKWRHGASKILTTMPYFEELVNYIEFKNTQIGNEILEDFFEGIYPVKKRIHKNNLKKCIRCYILNISDTKTSNSDGDEIQFNANTHMNVAKLTGLDTHMNVMKLTGLEGRANMFIALLDMTEKLTTPTLIKIFEGEQLQWVTSNMQLLINFYQKLKNIVNLGHKVEIIFQVDKQNNENLLAHQIFLELAFHKNVSIYTFFSKSSKALLNSIYILPGRLSIVGHCVNSNLNNMISCMYRDRQFISMQENIFHHYKSVSSPLMNIQNNSQIKQMLNIIKLTSRRKEAYFYSGKTLSIVTMSPQLLEEILSDNQIHKEQQRFCMEYYQALRDSIENTEPDEASGFYYVLDEIMNPLIYPTITNYGLSAITGKLIKMSRQQYLRHFSDTAEILLRNNKYRVVLHYNVTTTPITISSPKLIWYKKDSWALAANMDDYSEKVKFIFTDNPKISTHTLEGVNEILNRTSETKRDNAYVAQLFFTISRGEKV